MAVKRWPFKKSVDFGLGFRVDVIRKPLPVATGLYHIGKAKIELDNLPADTPLWEQYHAYAHELVHAANDFLWYVEHEIVEPMKEEARETKRLLEEEK